MSRIIEWLESHQMPCLYKKFLGVECPGCGMQTALIELLKGNVIESIKIYPALIPTLFLVFFLILHLIFKFKKGAFVLKISFIITGSLMFIHYIYRLLTN
jgi:hypothetical protein